MTHSVPVHPLVSPWGRFGLYSFFIDAPEPAIVDTGIASSPADGMAPNSKSSAATSRTFAGSCSPTATSTTWVARMRSGK